MEIPRAGGVLTVVAVTSRENKKGEREISFDCTSVEKNGLNSKKNIYFLDTYLEVSIWYLNDFTDQNNNPLRSVNEMIYDIHFNDQFDI